jgi:hypothetical protein
VQLAFWARLGKIFCSLSRFFACSPSCTMDLHDRGNAA